MPLATYADRIYIANSAPKQEASNTAEFTGGKLTSIADKEVTELRPLAVAAQADQPGLIR